MKKTKHSEEKIIGNTDDGDPKKRLELVSARREVALVMGEHRLSQRRACRLLEVDCSTYRYEPRPDRNAKLRAALIEAARQKPRFGYRRLWVELTTRQGFEASPGRVHRIYREEGLTVRRLKRKRLKSVAPANPLISRPNQEWALASFPMRSPTAVRCGH